MNIRAIEVMGNFISLENIAGVSEIYDYYKDGKSCFTLSYKSGTKYLCFVPFHPETKKTFNDLENIVIVSTDVPLNELREQIIKIVINE